MSFTDWFSKSAWNDSLDKYSANVISIMFADRAERKATKLTKEISLCLIDLAVLAVCFELLPWAWNRTINFIKDLPAAAWNSTIGAIPSLWKSDPSNHTAKNIDYGTHDDMKTQSPHDDAIKHESPNTEVHELTNCDETVIDQASLVGLC